MISILKFDTRSVVGRTITTGDVAANHRLATVFEISYTLAEFSNEFENQEGHDVRNIFNAQMEGCKKKLYQYDRKRIRTLSPHSHTQIILAS